MTEDTRFKELYADGMGAYLGEKYKDSIDFFRRAAELEPDNKLVLVSIGAAYLKLNRPEEALDSINRAIEIHGTYAKAYHLRGLVEERRGNDTEALQDITHAIELDPGYGAAYKSRAALHSKMGNDDLAMADIIEVTSLTNINLESFANENNVWRSHHLRVEQVMETELER